MRASLALRASSVPRIGGKRKPGASDKAQHASRKAILPLSRKLANTFPRHGPAAVRADIVSPALCDDILAIIAPSLEQYKNCDIIDVHPGVGLWSSKVHNLLKPRRHLLLEPDDVYKPFLQPLLDAPGSNYVAGPSRESALLALADVVAQGLLPDQLPLPKGDRRLNQTNTSLLLLLNLSRVKAPNGRAKYFITREIINRLTATAWTHTGIHQYGQVRTLFWTGESFTDRFVPKDLNGLDSHGFTFNHRTHAHVVAEHPSPKLPREDTTVELASAVKVADKMRSNGVEIPPHRQTRMHQTALSLLKKKSAEDIQAELRAEVIPAHSLLEELEGLQALRTSDKFSSKPNPRPWRERLEHLREYPEKTLKDRRRLHTYSKEVWRLADEMRQLEMIVVDESRPAQERLAAKEQWENLRHEVKQVIRRQNLGHQTVTYNVLDYRRGFYASPPLLIWDRRPVEPLTTQPHEFYPQHKLALLDMTPKPAPRDDMTDGEMDYWQRFATRLFERNSAPAGKALDNLRLGAGEALIPKVGAIHDPRRGGSLDVEDLRVRALTPEIMEELVDAWRKWPFRPEALEKDLTTIRLDWDDFVAKKPYPRYPLL